MSTTDDGWRTSDQPSIDRLIKAGRGRGEGTAYRPWLTVRDVPSRGLSTREYGWKTGRIHHVLSNLELDYLYCLEWAPSVVDIREQYPLLPLTETLSIAQRLGVPHPRHPHADQPSVMTTDFLVTVVREGKRVDEARAVKPSLALGDHRTLEKLEIERRYWHGRGVVWRIVTERELSHVLARNVQLVHAAYTFPWSSALAPEDLRTYARVLTDTVQSSDLPLRHCTSSCDRRLGLEPGTALALAYHLIATRQWQIDMEKPLDPTQRLTLLGGTLAMSPETQEQPL